MKYNKIIPSKFKGIPPGIRKSRFGGISALRTTLASLILVSTSVFSQVQELSTPPWRNSDTTLIQLCFDGLDSSAPKHLSIRTIGKTSMAGGLGAELIGLTLTERPIYQGAIDHPLRFQSALIRLPDSDISLRIDKPDDLEKSIDVWRSTPIAMCTADPRADFKILNDSPVEATACPENLGVQVSLKVTSYSEMALKLVHLKNRGPEIFNGLRGCREYVYGSRK